MPEGTIAQPLVRVEGLRKSFGGVHALAGVDIDIFPGEVHGLIGANGAGKSTLIKVLAGVVRPDAGLVAIDGAPVSISGPDHAASLGLGFIHQELNLVPTLNVLQNIVLGTRKPTRLGAIDWRSVRRKVEPLARKVGIVFPLDARIGALSTAERWLVTICRALVREVRLLVLDEPTASLSQREAENLFKILNGLVEERVALLYVSHRLDEIMSLCARVTAFRDGRKVMQATRAHMRRHDLVAAIVGEETPPARHAAAQARDTGAVVLKARGLTKGHAVRGVDLDLRRGEILGLAGLVGAGRSETVRLLFGAERPDAGTIELDGRPFAPRSPADGRAAGIGFVPEERRSEGLVLGKSVAFNLGLTVLPQFQRARFWPALDMGRRRAWAQDMVRLLTIKTADVDTIVGRLSGGNQQKVVIGKWLARRPRVLILDEPSRGVDVGARAEIHRLIRDRAAEGMAVIVISSEAEELPGLCDRVLVMGEGRILRELAGEAITREEIVRSSYIGIDARNSAA